MLQDEQKTIRDTQLLTALPDSPATTHILGFGLAAGRGERFRPLTLKAKGYLRAKAAVRFLGQRVLDWLVHILRRQGIDDFIMITKGKENRYQIKNILGYGESLGVRVRYSPVRFDHDNTGSADAVLTNLEYFDVTDTVFIFPTDSVLDIDLPGMLAAHQRTGAVVTIATAYQPAEVIAGRYGLIDCADDGRVRGFIEKPSLEKIYALFSAKGKNSTQLPDLPTNAGFYLIDARAVREICRHEDIEKMRQRQLDIGGDLLPWLVLHGAPVQTYQIDRMGDLGNIPSYLGTMTDALHGRFASLNSLLEQLYHDHTGAYIEAESLAMTDPISKLTLAEKIVQGLVTIRPPVRIGRYVLIYPGVTLSACNIDDDCEIYEDATLVRSSIGAGSIVGPYARVEDTLTGIMVELLSTRERPITLKRYVAIGDEVIVRDGVTMTDYITIHPRLKVPSGVRIPPHTDVESAEHILDCL